jgi:hypothetical protein
MTMHEDLRTCRVCRRNGDSESVGDSWWVEEDLCSKCFLSLLRLGIDLVEGANRFESRRDTAKNRANSRSRTTKHFSQNPLR